MERKMNGITQNATNKPCCFSVHSVLIVIVILLALLGIMCHVVVDIARSLVIKEQYFKERFASLPEVQRLFNLSNLTLNSVIFITEDPFFAPAFATNASEPTSLTQVVTELLLHTLAKQRELEVRICQLEGIVEIHAALLKCALIALVVYGIRCYWKR